jgi:hypothetical protein
MVYPSGVYDGSFKNDKFDGFGYFTDKKGNTYVGDWIQGKRCGDGTIDYS